LSFFAQATGNRSEVSLYPAAYIDLQVNRSAGRLVDAKEKILNDGNAFSGGAPQSAESIRILNFSGCPWRKKREWSHPREAKPQGQEVGGGVRESSDFFRLMT
jgi:hypothetical protein